MNKRKTIIIVVSIMLSLVLITSGIAFATSPSRHTCSVYPVSDIATTEVWDDEQNIYGSVLADQVQSVYLSDTQTLSDVFVTEGQSVQPGDKLLAYDTTLSEMEVTRKELEIQQMKEELTSAKKRYNTLSGSTVYTVSAPAGSGRAVRLMAPAKVGYRLTLLAAVVGEDGVVQTYARHSGSGTSDDPYLYVCANGVPFGEEFLQEIGMLATEEGGEPETTGPVYVIFGVSEDDQLNGKILQAGGVCFTSREGEISFITFDASDYIGVPFGESQPEPDPVEKSELESAVNKAEDLEKSPYTEKSVKSLRAAIALGKEVLANSSATQAEVNAAAASLNAAFDALEKKPDAPKPANKDALNKAIEKAEKVDKSQYTDKSTSALSTCITIAKGVKEKSDATQTEVDVAAKALNAAIDALEKKSSNSGNNNSNNNNNNNNSNSGKNNNSSTKPSSSTTPSSSTKPSSSTTPSSSTKPSSSTTPSSSTKPSGLKPSSSTTPVNSTTPSSSTTTSSSNSGKNNSGRTPTNVTPDSGTSYAEIQAEKADLQQKIKDLDLKLRMAEVELKRMNQELSDGVVYAEMAGTISSVLSADESLSSGEPVIKLSGGGGYMVQGSVDELNLDKVYIGQNVQITSWESGESYSGTVVEISDTPSDSDMVFGGGNMNVSYYPITVRIEGEANLRELETLELKLETEHEQTNAFYLEQPFILQENGNSYVYVKNEEGLLEKRQITTGVTLWGSSIQILDGLTLEDSIAFPYGKEVCEGARTKDASLDELYMG